MIKCLHYWELIARKGCCKNIAPGSCLKTGQHSISVIIKILICIFVFGAVSQILFKMVI